MTDAQGIRYPSEFFLAPETASHVFAGRLVGRPLASAGALWVVDLKSGEAHDPEHASTLKLTQRTIQRLRKRFGLMTINDDLKVGKRA